MTWLCTLVAPDARLTEFKSGVESLTSDLTVAVNSSLFLTNHEIVVPSTDTLEMVGESVDGAITGIQDDRINIRLAILQTRCNPVIGCVTC